MIVSRAMVAVVLGSVLTGCGPCDKDGLQARWGALVHPVQPEDALRVLEESCDDLPSLSEPAASELLEVQCPGLSPALWMDDTLAARGTVYADCNLAELPLGTQREFALSLGQPVLAAVLYHWLGGIGVSEPLRGEIVQAVRGPVGLTEPTDSQWTLASLPLGLPPLETPVGALVSAGEQGGRAAISTHSRYKDAWRLSQWVGLTGEQAPGERLGVLHVSHEVQPEAISLHFGESGLYIYRNGRRLGAQEGCGGAAVCAPVTADAVAQRLQTLFGGALPVQLVFGAPEETQVSTVLDSIAGALQWQPAAQDRLVLLPPQSPPVPILAEISPALSDVLTPITQPQYRGAAVKGLFDEMRPLGDQYCRMRTGQVSRDEDAVRAFVSGELFDNPTSPLSSLKSGCWNFFRMNDQRPADDFALVRALLPNDRLDCAGVGLLQPLMMHNEMGCETLTMIDFDWRILDVHSELVSLYAQDAFAGEVDLDTVLSSISLGWFARTEDAPPIQPASIATLCNYRERPLCADQLRRFQETWTNLHQIRLQLSALHDGTHVETDATRVLFLSNATERFYTTDAQAAQLVSNLTQSLSGTQQAYLIHHTGGSREFGIYRVENDGGSTKASVVCRDEYHQTANWTRGTTLAELPTYSIWLDTIAQTTPQTPTCRALLAEHLP